MNNDGHGLDEIKKKFSKNIFVTQMLGAKIVDAGDGYSKIKMDTSKELLNTFGRVMGGVHSTLADFAFGVAASADENISTLNFTINYYASMKGTTMFAEAHCLKRGKTVHFYEVDLTDDVGTYLAKAQIVGYKVEK